MNQVYLCNGELVCEACAVDVTDDDAVIGGDSDTPEHCAYCHRPLFDIFGLTEDGFRYVVAKIEERLREGTSDNGWRWEGGYYVGLGRCASHRDWCDLVLDTWYRIPRREERVLRWYRYLTEAQYDAQIAAVETSSSERPTP
jgi:hypothetical protein